MEIVRNAELDYRFGWRWLLPVNTGNRVVSRGLCEDEQQWWAQTQSLTLIPNQAENFDGYLIALDSAAPDAIVTQMNSATPRWLCAWGSGSSVSRLRSSLHGFGSIREYALLPAGKPRVVVPLSSPQKVVAGLRLHQPGRWLARVGLMVACGFARLEYYGLLRRRVLLIATREKGAVPQGADQAGMNASILSGLADYALYLGTPDDNRKTVVLPLGDALPSIILKVAETPKPRAALRNEARALMAMRMTSLAEQVPKLIGLDETDARLTLAQEFRQRHSVGRAHMSHAVGNFLAELSEIDRKQVGLADCLVRAEDAVCPKMGTCLSLAFVEVASSLYTRLRALANEGKQVCLHRSHGDFASWNCAWTDRGLFVFDWEESREHSLALGDAFYYVLSPFVHVQKNPDAGKALVMAVEFAADISTRSGLCAGSASHCETEARVYLALWLLGRLNLSPFYGELAVRLERSWK